MNSARPSTLNWIFRILGFIGLAMAAFVPPNVPSLGLDASWQMALGQFFTEGRQFGTEVIFTYGPLGWTTSNMYWGQQWAALVGWHCAVALAMAALALWSALQLSPLRRTFFLLFLFLIGLRNEDTQQQIAIVLIGLELIRRANRPWHWTSAAFISVLVVFSLGKFTNLTLAAAFIFLASCAPLRLRDWRSALRTPVWFFGLFVLGWILCGQNPLHLPAYAINSWEISSGYQDAMGWSCPSLQLYHGLAVTAVMIVYLGVNAMTSADRLRSLPLTLAVAAYLFLSWKHGFVRADGHQLIFYFAALFIVVGSPFLLEDGPRLRWFKQAVLLVAALLALRGAELAAPGLGRNTLPALKEKTRQQFDLLLHPVTSRQGYDWVLESLRKEVDLPLTRQVVGDRPLDVLGFEQNVAMINQLNYTPRPVFQSYLAYTPRLARLNLDHYLSDQAPEFVLLKLDPVDGRLAMMEDALLIDLLTTRYTYLFTEHGLSLWQRKSAPTAPAALHQPVRTLKVQLGEAIDLADLRDQLVWVRIDYRLSLLGHLRRFLFKPPQVRLSVTDETGNTSNYRLPAPMGKTGFLVNPVIRDVAEFLRAANGEGGRRVLSLAIDSSPQDRDCLQGEITVSLETVPVTPGAGWAALSLGDPALPLTFVRGHAPFGTQLSQVGGALEYFAHAPSTLVYRPAAGAAYLQGEFGLYAGAYADSNSGASDGAEFLVRWRTPDGHEEILFRRLLQPVSNPADRGLQAFRVPLPAAADGELEFVTTSGPNANSASDWTYWRGLHLENSR